MESFGDWLVQEMEDRRLDRKELARRSGLTQATITRLLGGTRGVGKKSISGLAKALDYPPGVIAEAAGLGNEQDDDGGPTALKRLVAVARTLSEGDLEELIYIALGKKKRRE